MTPNQPLQADDQTAEAPLVKLRWPWYWRLAGGIILGIILTIVSFEVVYGGKIYPGVTANGVYVGGLTRTQAERRLADRAAEYEGHALAIHDANTVMRIPVRSLSAKYDGAAAAKQAYDRGRLGNLRQQWTERITALIGQSSIVAVYSYSDSKLEPYINQLVDDTVTPVADAALAFNDAKTQVTPAQPGERLDIGRLVQLIEARLAATDEADITAPVYQQQPVIDTKALTVTVHQADTYLAGPVTITYDDITKQIDQGTIIGWLKINRPRELHFMNSMKLPDLYPPVTPVGIELDRTAVDRYVGDLARRVNRTAQNAALNIQDGRATVFQASHDGVTLDQTASTEAILGAMSRPADNRTVELTLKVTKPDVNEENLNNLGIKELISEGQTFFPGSTAARLTNVRVGAGKFNGVLLKPDEVFSFGALLGDVGPEQGYKPELVILADHEEKQYGGGLCQVSSTAFRAALNAGLPIVERHNHSFAISYYTAPFGVPGVDATIYYPQIDFKFKNDTGSYILIQTIMQGTTLKFQFYGTKTKSGTIRGPQFVTGSNDATQPSRTVFWRDVLDLEGKVTKTDTFYTNYKSSKDFPVQKEFN